ncbi:MAG: cytochrome c3 family protein [Tepidisphaeraceae bacterium]
MRHPKLLLGTVALSLCFAAQTMAQSISTSPHNLNTIPNAAGTGNLSITGPRTTGEICRPCHTPHKAIYNSGSLIWNHDVNMSQSYTMYTSVHVTANSGPGGSSANPQLDSTSRLCLSCHDGLIAVDSYGGATTGTVFMQNISTKYGTGQDAIAGGTSATPVAGSDLSADHPVGVGYPGLTATVSGGYVTSESWTPVAGWNDPTQSTFTTGGVDGLPAVNLVPLPNGLVGVGCGTCHEPHDFSQLFVRMNNSSSALCLKCHNK